MRGTEIFDELMASKKVSVYLSAAREYSVEALRVSLVRKFQDYKYQMDRLGFLDDELKEYSVSMELDGNAGIATFFLRKRKKTSVSYLIVMPTPTIGTEDTP